MPAAAAYTLQGIASLLGMRPAAVRRLINAGFVTPARGVRNEFRFTFQDLVLLRTAQRLQAAKVPARRLLRSLQRLKSQLPQEVPMSGLRIQAIGDTVAIRDRDSHWEADTGQLLLDFESGHDGTATVAEASPAPAAVFEEDATDEPDAQALFDQGERVEGTDVCAAIAAYSQALALDPAFAAAAVNLCALSSESGDLQGALAVYEQAAVLAPDDAALHFNGAIAQEDLGRYRDAIATYERCLTLAPSMADAHFNLARLHERLGDQRGMLRHFNAYRRLQRVPEER